MTTAKQLTSIQVRASTLTPAERLAILRIAVGAYATLFCVIRFAHLWNAAAYPKQRWESVGILTPIMEAPPVWIFRSILIVAIATGVLFIIGYRFHIFGPVFAVSFLAITTFRFSWGSVLHTEHLLVVHILIIAASGAGHAFSYNRSPKHNLSQLDSSTKSENYMWAIHVAAFATVIGYVVSGVAKLRYGGWDWVSGDVLRNQIAFDNVRKIALGDLHSPFAGWIIRNDAVLAIFAPLTLLCEIAAPLALLQRTLRNVWVVGIWLFHVGVLLLMAILFPYQILGIAYLPLFLMTPLLQKSQRHNALVHDDSQLAQLRS